MARHLADSGPRPAHSQAPRCDAPSRPCAIMAAVLALRKQVAAPRRVCSSRCWLSHSWLVRSQVEEQRCYATDFSAGRNNINGLPRDMLVRVMMQMEVPSTAVLAQVRMVLPRVLGGRRTN